MSRRRVSVLYPRGVQTGGPEALHQLVDALRAHGVEAGLWPHPNTVMRPRVPAYEVYDAPEVAGPLDVAGDVVIGPEIYLRELLSLRSAHAFCWWLSIDNSRLFRTELYYAAWRKGLADPPGLRDVRALGSFLLRGAQRWKRELRRLDHLAQSEYAADFLRDRVGVRAAMVTDYLSLPFGDESSSRPAFGEVPRIAFNPAKGRALNARVQSRLPRPATWDPIAGLQPHEVIEHLRAADIYLDLGPQPGKDRLPREAAMSGAITIVAERGSGAVQADTPLPEAHKVSVTGDPVQNAIEVLERVLDDPLAAYAAQAGYRAHIREQERAFRRQVGELAHRLQPDTGRGGPDG